LISHSGTNPLLVFYHPHATKRLTRALGLLSTRAALRKLIESDPRSPIRLSDHGDCDGTLFFKHAAELGLEGIDSKRGAWRLYLGGPPENWLKIKNMVEGKFILLGIEADESGIPEEAPQVRRCEAISGLQQTLMAIFSAVMSINDRPPCISYTCAAL
jgi:hypothetical protein